MIACRRFGAVLGLLVIAGCMPKPLERASSYNPSGASVSAPTFKTFPIYTHRTPRHTHYVPSGYMGDSDLTMAGAYIPTAEGPEGACVRVYYKANGPKGWAGVYWQDPANNWGEVAGKAGYDLRGAVKLSFWARGAEGGERVHEFRVGGIVGQYPDSDVASLSNVRLTREWKKYEIDLRKKDLRHVIGGFAFLVLEAENPGGMSFYLDDIMYEGPDGPAGTASAAVAASSAPVTTPLVSTASAVSPVVSTPTVPALSTATIAAGSKDMRVQETEAGLRVSFSSRILFETGKAALAPVSHRALDQLIGLLSAYPKNRVLIEGHTDSTGDAGFNLKLSELRAQSIRDYLIKQGGYDAARFEVVGYGATRPVADNNTREGRLLNRRVEVTILKNAK